VGLLEIPRNRINQEAVMSFDKILERVTNVAILASVLGLATVLATGGFPAAKTAAPRYKVGETLQQLDSRVNFADSTKTVLLYTNSNCQFCQASIPFYKRLIARRDERRSRVPIVAIAKQPQQVLDDYLRLNGVQVDKAIELKDLSKFSMNSTPTLLVVDSKGVILDIWIGLIPSGDEEKALNVVLD
jgi:hypothetical protein